MSTWRKKHHILRIQLRAISFQSKNWKNGMMEKKERRNDLKTHFKVSKCLTNYCFDVHLKKKHHIWSRRICCSTTVTHLTPCDFFRIQNLKQCFNKFPKYYLSDGLKHWELRWLKLSSKFFTGMYHSHPVKQPSHIFAHSLVILPFTNKSMNFYCFRISCI